jgi:hypothetical protein
MADIELQEGDTLPSVSATLIGPDGGAVDISGADVVFIMEDSYSSEKIFSKSAMKTDPANGKVEYQWDAEDTNTSGFYEARWKVTFNPESSNPDVQHFPNDSEGISISID